MNQKDLATKKDLKQLTTKKELKHLEDKVAKDLKQVEERLTNNLVRHIEASEKRIIVEVGNFIEDRLMPSIDEKADKKDVDRHEEDIRFIKDRLGVS